MEIQRDSDLFKAFSKNYLEYFLELEREFLQTRKYVEFCKDNNATFSIEYLKLYQAVCSEIDVVGKAMAKVANDAFKPDDKQNNIVDYVIVGGYNEEGNADPSMITFVYRTGFKDRKDANHFKPERLNAAKKKIGSDSHTKEVCQSDDTSSNSSLSHSGLQSLIPDDSNILQSNTSPDAFGDCGSAKKNKWKEG